jgi:tRNA/tmRNA/rRNA uracil-C5-methylase (TrmA/RlmC/RlmD family)
MDLAARRSRGGVVLGLHRQRSREVVDLTMCLVLHPALVGLMSPLRGLLARLQAFRREGSVIANLLDSGIDLLVRSDASLKPIFDSAVLQVIESARQFAPRRQRGTTRSGAAISLR